jgi:hypothetical protein
MMTKTQEKEFNQLIEMVSKSLIASMNVLKLKSHIEMISRSEGFKYTLRFDKEKLT